MQLTSKRDLTRRLLHLLLRLLLLLHHHLLMLLLLHHHLLALLRLRGIPARYVSGYLHVEAEQGVPSQSHAWVEAWSPTLGWLAMDPTNDLPPDERYVVVATGRDYDDVPPKLHAMARRSLLAHLHKLRDDGRIIQPDIDRWALGAG